MTCMCLIKYFWIISYKSGVIFEDHFWGVIIDQSVLTSRKTFCLYLPHVRRRLAWIFLVLKRQEKIVTSFLSWPWYSIFLWCMGDDYSNDTSVLVPEQHLFQRIIYIFVDHAPIHLICIILPFINTLYVKLAPFWGKSH